MTKGDAVTDGDGHSSVGLNLRADVGLYGKVRHRASSVTRCVTGAFDDHALDMMLDLTGERRAVPAMGREAPAEPASALPASPATPATPDPGTAAHGLPTRSEAHAGACEGMRIAREVPK